MFVFSKINTDTSRSLPSACKLQTLRFTQGDSEKLSMTARFFTPSYAAGYWLPPAPRAAFLHELLTQNKSLLP